MTANNIVTQSAIYNIIASASLNRIIATITIDNISMRGSFHSFTAVILIHCETNIT